MSRINAIYGYGGFAREVFPMLNDQYPEHKNIFIVHKKFMPHDKFINNHPLMSFEDFLQCPEKEKYLCIAISDSKKRALLSKEIDALGIKKINVISKNTIIMDEVSISKGAIICPFVTLTSNIKIGENFHANLYSYVAHDCVIGNNVTFAPSVKCNGNVIIEDNVYIGTGAIIKQGKHDKPITIGKSSIISAGSYVTRSVEPSTTVYGNPAKKLSKSSLK